MSSMAVSDAYRRSVAWLLMIVYAFNFADRQILSVLLPQIQAEFGANDTLAGLLHGTAFALFYVTLALPIARWADRGNRVRIIVLATAVWSVMTALCGMARSFFELFLARVGVGVGEAGCSPAAYSILSGYFPAAQRPGAMAIYGAGIPLGSAAGLVLGGMLAEALGWRDVFLIFGIPGILLALFVLFYVREPLRSEDKETAHPTFMETLRALGQRRSFIHATIATSLLAFAGYGAGTWVASFLYRSHSMSVGMIGLALGLVTIAAVPAVIIGGRYADRMVARGKRFHFLVPAIAMLVGAPFGIAGLIIPGGTIDLAGLAVPGAVLVIAMFTLSTAANAIYTGPVLAAIQTMVGEKMRAMTIAVFFFMTNLVGLGLGPVVIGAISDALKESLGAESLRAALFLTVAINLWAAWHFILAARHAEKDLGDR